MAGSVPTPDDFRRERLERRLSRTLNLEVEVAGWAAQHGLTLRVLNDGHHWLLQKPGFVAEWWPSSARVVLNRDCLRGRHAPHWAQVAALIHETIAAMPAQTDLFASDSAGGPCGSARSKSDLPFGTQH
jgi:hypothetical protein